MNLDNTFMSQRFLDEDWKEWAKSLRTHKPKCKTTECLIQDKEIEIPFDESDEKVLASLKIDGEMRIATVLMLDNKLTWCLVSYYGRVTWNLPITDELNDAFDPELNKENMILGELYAIDNNNNPLPFNETTSIIKKPKSIDATNSLRFAIFGNSNNDTIADNIEYLLNFKNSFKLKYSHVVKFVYTNKNELMKSLWKSNSHYEGVIYYLPDSNILIKQKKIRTIDLTVVGVKNDTKRSHSTIICGIMENDTFNFICYAAGLKFEEMDWLKNNTTIHITNKYNIIFNEMFVAEIKFTEFTNIKENGLPSLRHPRLMRFRSDKNPDDIDNQLLEFRKNK